MKIKSDYLYNVYWFFSIAYIFTYYMYGFQWQIVVALSVFLFFLFFSSRKKIKFNFFDFILFLFGSVIFIGALNGPSSINGTLFALCVFCMIFSVIIFRQQDNFNYKYIIKLLFVFSSIHVFSSILYFFFPNIIQNILPYLLKPSDLAKNIYEYNFNGIICGISPVQGLNAIYISIYIMIVYCSYFYNNDKKILKSLFLFLGLLALFLASKRGLLLGNIISMFIVYFYYKYKMKQIDLKTIFKISIIVSIFVIIIYNILINFFPQALDIFYRFKQSDLLTGRGDLWSIGWKNFKSNSYLLGSGLFSSRFLIGTITGSVDDLHNIYLQFLVELGVVGFTVLILNILNILKKFFDLNFSDNKKNNFIILLCLYYFINFFIYGFTGNWIFDVTLLFLFFIILSVFMNLLYKEGVER